MKNARATAELQALLAGEEPKKLTRVVSGGRAIDLIRLPGKITEYYAAQGKNVFPVMPHHSLIDLYASRGAYPLMADDLPESERESMLRDARIAGYTVRPDDQALAKGGCVLFVQLESERQEWEDEDRTMLDAQLGEQVNMEEALNAQLASEFPHIPGLRPIGRAQDGEPMYLTNPNPQGR